MRTIVSDTAGVTVTVHIGGYYELTNGTQGRSYYHHNDRPIAMRDGSGLHWLLADHLGSTTLVADAGGAAEGELRYSPFGVTLYEEGTAATDRRFTGQRWQATVGLYDYRARWYDPRLGRFVSPDTIVPEPGEPQSLNRFSYVYGNPLKHTDPTGRDPREWDPAWVRRFVDAHGYLPCEQDWLDYLFSLEHPGSGPNGAWTPEDWDAYREIRMLLGPSLLRQIGSAGGPYALYTRIGHLLAGPSVGTWALHDDVLLTASHDVPPGASAWTWGDLVILHTGYWIHDPGSRQLQLTLIHEYVHVLQYRKHGLSFGVKYLAGGLSWNTNPFEVQAVAVEDWYRQHPHFPAPWTFTWPREERYLAYTRWPW